MARVTWECAALYYLNWWLLHDRQYCSALGGSDPEQQRLALCRAAVTYGVARNLPLAHDKDIGIERLKPVADALMAVPRSDIEGPNLVPTIHYLRDTVSAAYGAANLLSLATKFLWLRFRSPVQIYDGNVSSSLGANGRDVAEYYQIWHAEYARSQSYIANSCNLLPGVSAFCVDPSATPGSVATIAQEPWFQERVFDIYHWHAGA